MDAECLAQNSSVHRQKKERKGNRQKPNCQVIDFISIDTFCNSSGGLTTLGKINRWDARTDPVMHTVKFYM